MTITLLDVKISKYKLPLFKKSISTLNSKLKKYSLPEINIIEGNEYLDMIGIPVICLDIENIIPEQDNIPLGVFISSKGTYEYTYAKEFYNLDKIDIPDSCAHCGQVRDKKTYLIYNPTKQEIKALGVKCLKKYLDNPDADKIVDIYIKVYNLIEQYSCMSLLIKDNIYTVNGSEVIPFDYFLIKACALVRTEGYKKGGSGVKSTGQKTMDRNIEFIANKQDITLSEAINTWIKNLDPKSSYEHRIKSIQKIGYVDYSGCNLIASVLYSYKEACIKRNSTNVEEAEIGKTVNLTCKLVKLLSFPVNINGLDKICYKYIFKTESGGLYSWLTNTVLDVEEGSLLTVTGIIKGQESYKDIKYTTIKRCLVGKR